MSQATSVACLWKSPAVLVALLFVCLAAPADAAVTVDPPEIGFDNNYMEGCWAPVTVTMHNSGDTFTGDVEVLVPQRSALGEMTYHSYRRPVELPGPRSSKSIQLNVFFPTKNVSEVVVQFRKGRRVYQSPPPMKMNVRGYAREDRIFAYVNDGPARILGDSGSDLGTSEKLWFFRLQPDRFPNNSAAYEGLAGVFIGDFDPGQVSSTEARRALEYYVRSGGNLVVFTGGAGDRYRGTWIEDLLPVRLYNTQTVESVAEIARHYREPMPQGRAWVLAESELRGAPFQPGFLLTRADDGLPLVVRSNYGAGQVTFVALGYADAQPLMPSLLLACQPIPQIGMRNERVHSPIQIVDLHSRHLEEQMRQHPAMSIPNFTFMGGFLVLYVIILGPVNYIILKKKKRLELAWVTVPAIVLLFSAGAYAVGRFTKGNEVVVHSMTFARGQAGFSGLGYESYFGLFSPSKTSYDVSVQDGESVIREYRDPGKFSGGMQVRVDAGISMPDYGMNMWTMDTFATFGFWEGSGAGGLEGEVLLEGETASGEIENLYGFDLRECHLLVGNEMRPIGDLQSGGTHSFEGMNVDAKTSKIPSLQNNLSMHFGSDHEQELANQGLALALQESFSQKTTGATLWAWIDTGRTPIPAIDVGRAHDREGATLVKIGLPIRTNWGVIPYGISRRQVVERKGGVQERNDSVFIAGGHVTLDFHLPAGVRADRVKNLQVYYNVTNSRNVVFEIAVWDWRGNNWRNIAVKNSSPRETVTIDTLPAALVRPADPVVRIRVMQKEEDDGGRGAVNMNPFMGGDTVDGKPAIGLVELDVRAETRE